jgi:hypothetical protein
MGEGFKAEISHTSPNTPAPAADRKREDSELNGSKHSPNLTCEHYYELNIRIYFERKA